MGNLPDASSRRKSAPFENPAASPRPVPPPGLAGLGLDRPDEFYRLLTRCDVPASVHKLARYLQAKAIEFRDSGTWMSLRAMSRESGIKISTVRAGMKRLLAAGFVVAVEVEAFGESRTMFWLRWLLSGPAGPIPECAPKSARRARFSAQDGARQSARLEEERIQDITALTLARLSPGGEEELAPSGPPSGFRAEDLPAAPPTLSRAEIPSPATPEALLPPARVEELVAVVRSRQHEFLRKIAYYELEAARQIPPDLAGIFPPLRGDRPEDEAPRPSCAAAVAPPPPPAGVPHLPDVEALMRRLAQPHDAAQLAALADSLAGEMARSLGDPGWRNCFRKRVLLTGQGKLKLKPLIRAYTAARRSDSETRGRLMVKLHNEALGHEGGPIEGFLGGSMS